MVHMEYYLVVSTFMMFAGIYGFFTRRNLLAMLISVELILNSVDINFAVFNRYLFPENWKVSFRLVRHWCECGRNSSSYCHHYQYLPQCTQYPSEELK